MLEIDGSFGSGGGQILRTALGLSTVKNIPCKVTKIRAKRPIPGLREQHLQVINALTKLSGGKATGVRINSTEIEFYPTKNLSEKIDVKISTAGSIALLLQALSISAMKLKKLEVKISGGATWGKWAPPVLYFKHVLSKLLKMMNFNIYVKILNDGFYPKGGGGVLARFENHGLKKLEIPKRGEVKELNLISVASKSLREKKVAERQAQSATTTLSQNLKLKPKIEINYLPTESTGSGILIWIAGDDFILGSSALGERGKSSEDVGKESAQKLIEEYRSGATVDSHAADQILPFIAFSGGKLRTSKITEHCRTNIYVIEKFLPVKFNIKNGLIEV